MRTKPGGWEIHPDLTAIPEAWRGAIAFLPFWRGAGNPTKGQFQGKWEVLTPDAGIPGYAPTPFGWAYSLLGGAADGVDLGRDILGGLSEFTAHFVVYIPSGTSITSTGGILSHWFSGDTTFLWRYEGTTGAMRALLVCSGGTADTGSTLDLDLDVLECITCRYDGSELSLWQNGVKGATGSTSGTVNTVSSGNYWLGDDTGPSTAFAPHRVLYGLVTRHAWGDDLIGRVHACPFDVISPEPFEIPSVLDLPPPGVGATGRLFKRSPTSSNLYNGLIA